MDDDDIAAVTRVLKGDWLSQGPGITDFEEALALRTGARFAVAFANGTAALHAAVAAGGLGHGDVVATSPLSFIASANCALYVGATPTFVDIDAETLNIDLSRVPTECDGLVAVHYAGLPVELSRLRKRPRVVIEDAAHALGAETPDGPVGNCAQSDMCAFSFHPVKPVTTGEGGAVTTNSAQLAEALRRFRNHGIVHKPEEGGWFYEVSTLGFNYRMTDLQAALGVSQLTKLHDFRARRREIAERYRKQLSDLPLELPPGPPPGRTHAWNLFPIRVADRRLVYERMRAAGIGVQVHFVPIYRHPLYRAQVPDRAAFPETERAYSRLLSLPLYPDLAVGQQDTVIDALRASV